MDLARRVNELLEESIAHGEIPGVVVAIADRQGLRLSAAAGLREQGGGEAMTVDTVFWIASMTKAITATAAMQLVERGLLTLDRPVTHWLPRIGQLQVLEGFGADGQPRLRPPRRAVTLRHLLTHTAGMAYEFVDANFARYLENTGAPSIVTGQLAALAAPMVCDPGERWVYGTALDWVGQLVEAVTGQPLGRYLEDHIFAPLGMVNTSFKLRPEQRSRLAGMHARDEQGNLAVIPFEFSPDAEFEGGGGGLYGTLPDYMRFTRMLLGGGRLDGAQVLQPETVERMRVNQISGIDCGAWPEVIPSLSREVGFFPGLRRGWGLSFLLNLDPVPGGRSAGSASWAGLANSYYWVDFERGLTAALATQILPFFDPAVVRLLNAFERELYAA